MANFCTKPHSAFSGILSHVPASRCLEPVSASHLLSTGSLASGTSHTPENVTHSFSSGCPSKKMKTSSSWTSRWTGISTAQHTNVSRAPGGYHLQTALKRLVWASRCRFIPAACVGTADAAAGLVGTEGGGCTRPEAAHAHTSMPVLPRAEQWLRVATKSSTSTEAGWLLQANCRAAHALPWLAHMASE